MITISKSAPEPRQSIFDFFVNCPTYARNVVLLYICILIFNRLVPFSEARKNEKVIFIFGKMCKMKAF
jgi:hypothetical protein